MINRRKFMERAFFGATGSLFLTSCTQFVTPKKTNVLFIAVDDLNDWIGCMHGHPNTKTPNIDKLAARGTLFTNSHCQAPICGPSRASLMTGLYPSTTGIYGQIYDDDIRNANSATESSTFLPEYFRQNGYKTMGVGKLFHTHAPKGVFDISGGRAPGFGPKPEKRMKWEGKSGPDYQGTATDWGPFPERDEEMPDYQSAQWVRDRLNEEHEKPFFLAVGFLRPHVPWHVPQKWFDLHPEEQLELPPYLPSDYDDIPEIGRQVADLAATIRAAGEGGVEAVAVGTPIDLARLIEIPLPSTRVRYDLDVVDGPSLDEILAPVVQRGGGT